MCMLHRDKQKLVPHDMAVLPDELNGLPVRHENWFSDGTPAATTVVKSQMRRAAMQHTLIIGSTVRCADDTASGVGGLIINPNRSHVDYVILNSGGPAGASISCRAPSSRATVR